MSEPEELLFLCEDLELLIHYLISVDLINEEQICKKCGHLVKLNLKTLRFVCRKSRRRKQNGIRKQCGWSKSALHMSFGRLRNVNIQTFCQIIAIILQSDTILTQAEVSEKCGVTKSNANSAIAFCARVFHSWRTENYSGKIGGAGHTVQIGLMGSNLFGGLDPVTEECFIETVPLKYHKRRKYFSASESELINRAAESRIAEGSVIEVHYKMPHMSLSHNKYVLFTEENTEELKEVWRNFAEKGGRHYWRHVNEYLFKKRVTSNRNDIFFRNLYLLRQI